MIGKNYRRREKNEKNTRKKRYDKLQTIHFNKIIVLNRKSINFSCFRFKTILYDKIVV